MLCIVDGKVVPPGVLVQTEQGWVEPEPTRCPVGHVLRAGETLVGWVPCMAPEWTGHRTHECPCGEVVYTPPDECGHRTAPVMSVEFTPADGPALDMTHLFAEQPRRELEDDSQNEAAPVQETEAASSSSQ